MPKQLFEASANIILASLNQKVHPFRVVELFLLLQRDIAFRMLGIVYSLFRGQGQIFSQKAGAQEIQPNHTVTLGKRLCILHLQHMNPSQQRWLFHEFRVFVGLQRVPKLCVRYVRRQLGVWFENQGQLAKNSPLKINKIDNIRVSAPRFFPQDILG